MRSLTFVFRTQTPEGDETSVEDFEKAVRLKRQEFERASRRLGERRRQAEESECITSEYVRSECIPSMLEPNEQKRRVQESAEERNRREVREFMEQRAQKRREYQAKKAQLEEFMAQRAQARLEYLANKASDDTQRNLG
jgi:hypothetical protein